ncbi:OmpA family protein [Sediminibacterium ginsengisoli]|uniref:Outer membrane protein OmpA n=1 Tax=Sediminibacterium ginsengisoli TaxID=413434 RepID=A0A1T4R8K1_9BACT|nr:OmpA family protein [Sediminibacterium ginsengisoli]SKA12146.1 Outer membrane protein OmpA [Sediminibacterium ginsengisoli]
MRCFIVLAILFCTQTIGAQQQKLSVYFRFNSASLDSSERKKIDSILYLNKTGMNTVDIFGYCDAIGNNTYNDSLAWERVNAVLQYFGTTTIAKGQVGKAEAYGKRKPANSNLTEEERLRNRRVDIFITNDPQASTATAQTPAVPQQPSLEKRVSDSSLKAGDNLVLKNLNFIGGRHMLVRESIPAAYELLEVMKKFSTLEIEIQGHICCAFGISDGLDIDTQTNNLSENRARSIYEFLVRNGIAASRLSYRGFGSSKPMYYPERTIAQMDANRRVEIKIIRK